MFALFGPILAQSSQGSRQAPGSPFGTLLMLVPMFLIMYLLLIRPQQKKAKEHREMVARLKVGDRVISSGGIHGTITEVREQSVMVEICEGTCIEFSRSSIGAVHDES
jgi:preprotein translocase subunit YajC